MSENTPPNPGMICFDLGRVLIRIADDWRDACARAQVVAPDDIDHPELRMKLHEVMEEAGVGRFDAADLMRRIAAITPFTVAEVRRISANWLRGPFAGVNELLAEVCATRLCTACLSNTNDHHWQLMSTREDPNYLPLERLDYRFASHLIGHAKPDEHIYAHVERATDIDPRTIVFFDDTLEHCEAARSRGWQAHLIERNGNPVEQMRRHLRDARVL